MSLQKEKRILFVLFSFPLPFFSIFFFLLSSTPLSTYTFPESTIRLQYIWVGAIHTQSKTLCGVSKIGPTGSTHLSGVVGSFAGQRKKVTQRSHFEKGGSPVVPSALEGGTGKGMRKQHDIMGVGRGAHFFILPGKTT